ncbi:MAG: hypothetical protein RL220_378 [Bacteroidota bacterium]
MLHIQTFTFNPFQENTYVIHTPDGECIIVDPGMSNTAEENSLATYISEHNLRPVRLLLTHAHIDHILGNEFVHRKYHLLPEMHEAEISVLERAPQSAQLFGISYSDSPKPDNLLKEGDTFSIGGYQFGVLFVPGHAPGHLAFYCAELSVVISGDVLFEGSVGRVDLPGCNAADLLNSIQKKMYALPEDTQVLPGHGAPTTIGAEKRSNYFVRENDQNLI